MDDRSERLHELGRADLAGRFDAARGMVHDPFLPERHSPHHTLWYALCLLETDSALAEQLIANALDLQELRKDDPHYGNFRWHAADEGVLDLNGCQFVLEGLLRLPLERLRGALRERIVAAMRLAYSEAERLDVHWTYTNIYLLDAHNRILGAAVVGDESLGRRGAERLAEWWERTKAVGAPHEFNSPTYAAVQLNCLADIANRAPDRGMRALALEAEEGLWRHIAAHWHAATGQLAGPHSRAYRRDVVGAAGFLKVVLYRLLGDERLLEPSPYYTGPDAEGHVIVSGTEYHCPPDALRLFTESATRTVRETVAVGTETTTLVTPSFSLGTMSRPYGVGEPPEAWPASNNCIAYWRRDGELGYGVLYCRYRTDAGAVGAPGREGVPKWMDIWEDGVFRAAQEGGRAIVAYGLRPRLRAARSQRLDVRLLGPDASAVRTGGAVWDGERCDLEPGTPVAVADGEAFVGVMPLEPTGLGHTPAVTVWRDGDETVVSIVNYEGPAKSWWEYRSLSGPFWKGNVRNGFALWIALREEFADVAAFERALVETPLLDAVEGTVRRITFGDARLEYDLREMRD